jgi:hypothetical protein
LSQTMRRRGRAGAVLMRGSCDGRNVVESGRQIKPLRAHPFPAI